MLLLVARVGRLLLAAEEGKQQQQQEEEKEEGERYDTAARESYLCHLHRGQKQPSCPQTAAYHNFLPAPHCPICTYPIFLHK